MQAKKKNQQNLAFEKEFLETLIQKDPGYTDALILLGELFTKNKELQKALKIDLKLTQLKPKDPIVFYNLACDYSLLNKKILGLKALEKCFELGYDDIDYLFKDNDLKNIRESKRFDQILKKYSKAPLSSELALD